MTSSAPAARTASLLRGLAVATTCTPARSARATAYLPTTPPAPLMSTRWPACRAPSSKRACQAVNATDGRAAASASGMVVGAATSASAGSDDVLRRAAVSLHRQEPDHRVPDLQPEAP